MAQCSEGDVLIGEDDEKYICWKRSAYEGSPAQRYGTRYCRQRQLVSADQDAARRLNIALDAERFETFADAARDQKASIEQQLFGALLDQGLQATQLAVNSARSLNPWNVNRAADMLTAKGFGHPRIISALRRVARARDKPAMAAAYARLTEEIDAAREGWSTGVDMAADPTNAKLRLIVGALKVMQGNPQLGLAVTGAEVGESLVYLVYLSGQVNDLALSSDDRLAQLARLSTRLRAHVDTMSTAKRSWRRTTASPNGWPHCSQIRGGRI